MDEKPLHTDPETKLPKPKFYIKINSEYIHCGIAIRQNTVS